ncbi:MAG: hypothetical protein ACI4KF_05690 [Huintestinicola sp.]
MTRFAEKIVRLFRKVYVENLMTYIVATIALVWIGDLLLGNRELSGYLAFDRDLILSGQVWRAVTFLFIPSTTSPVWIIFSLYFYYAIGSALEHSWGSSGLTAYYFTAALLTIAAGFITGYATNVFLNYSLFFAFAALYGNTQFMLFFLIPIKAKWLAWLDAVYMLGMFVMGGISIKAGVAAALIAVALFFGGDFIGRIKNKIRHREFLRKQ